MGKRDGLTRFLAVTGTVLVWLPLLAPVFFSLLRLLERARLMFDYLMPAELFPVELLGGILLTVAAFMAGSRKKLIGWSLAAAILFLVGGQGLAVLTGLASGRTDPNGWQLSVVMFTLVLFILALVMLGIGGCLLIKDLSKRKMDQSGDLQPPQG